MNHKRPATYCNKADKALVKARFYLEQMAKETLMESNNYYKQFTRLAEAASQVLDEGVRREVYLHPSEWDQNK